MKCEMERSPEAQLSLCEQKEICNSLGCSNLEEDDDDLLGPMTISEPGFTFAVWPHCCRQSLLLELLNKGPS